MEGAGSVVALDASFWSRALATLIGTVAGFIFSIALFYLSETVKRSRERSKIIAGLKREASFNVALCDAWLAGVGDLRVKVAAGDRNVFHYFDYSRALRIFVQEAVRAGVLYDLLTDAELVEVDKALVFLGPVSEAHINPKIIAWKDSEAITSVEMSHALNFHEYWLKEVRRAMERLRQKAAA